MRYRSTARGISGARAPGSGSSRSLGSALATTRAQAELEPVVQSAHLKSGRLQSRTLADLTDPWPLRATAFFGPPKSPFDAALIHAHLMHTAHLLLLQVNRFCTPTSRSGTPKSVCIANQLCDHRLVFIGPFLLAEHPLVKAFPGADVLLDCSRLPSRKRPLDGSEGSQSGHTRTDHDS